MRGKHTDNGCNLEIRREAKKHDVALWQIAQRLGIHESTFIKRLRAELPAADKAAVLEIIAQIAAEKRGA